MRLSVMTTSLPIVGDQLRAYRFALDLTFAQRDGAAHHAGAARWAFNHALAVKQAAWAQRNSTDY